MEQSKKKNKGLIVFLVLLILIILGLVGYICYDKKLIFNDNKAVSTSNKLGNKLEKEQNLDINSRLVQTLYNSVTSRNEFCSKYSIYGTVKENDYIVDEVSEKDKMALVQHNLKNNYYETISCTDVNVPDVLSINVNGTNIDYYSGCSANNPDNYERTLIEQRFIEKRYSKKYVESIYKSLFGKDAKLDTSVPITSYGPEAYFYNKDIDSYIKYAFAGGGTCGPIKYKDEIEKAVLKGDTLKIYEKTIVTTGENDSYDINGNLKHEDATTSTNYHVYTFLRESDGMYKFVSRIKESK